MKKKISWKVESNPCSLRGRRAQSPLYHGAIGAHMHRESSINLSIRWLTVTVNHTVNHREFNEKWAHLSIPIRLYFYWDISISIRMQTECFGVNV